MAAYVGENMMISVVLVGFACVIIGTETDYSMIGLIFGPRNRSLAAPKTAAAPWSFVLPMTSSIGPKTNPMLNGRSQSLKQATGRDFMTESARIPFSGKDISTVYCPA